MRGIFCMNTIRTIILSLALVNLPPMIGMDVPGSNVFNQTMIPYKKLSQALPVISQLGNYSASLLAGSANNYLVYNIVNQTKNPFLLLYATQGICVAYLMFNNCPIDCVIPQITSTQSFPSQISQSLISGSGYALGEFMYQLTTPLSSHKGLSCQTIIQPIVQKGMVVGICIAATIIGSYSQYNGLSSLGLNMLIANGLSLAQEVYENVTLSSQDNQLLIQSSSLSKNTLGLLAVLGSSYVLYSTQSLNGLDSTTQMAMGAVLGTTLGLVQNSVIYKYTYETTKSFCQTSYDFYTAAASSLFNTCSAFGFECFCGLEQ